MQKVEPGPFLKGQFPQGFLLQIPFAANLGKLFCEAGFKHLIIGVKEIRLAHQSSDQLSPLFLK